MHDPHLEEMEGGMCAYGAPDWDGNFIAPFAGDDIPPGYACACENNATRCAVGYNVYDQWCDDGGKGAWNEGQTDGCDFGYDCGDCGPRWVFSAEAVSPPPLPLPPAFPPLSPAPDGAIVAETPT